MKKLEGKKGQQFADQIEVAEKSHQLGDQLEMPELFGLKKKQKKEDEHGDE